MISDARVTTRNGMNIAPFKEWKNAASYICGILQLALIKESLAKVAIFRVSFFRVRNTHTADTTRIIFQIISKILSSAIKNLWSSSQIFFFQFQFNLINSIEIRVFFGKYYYSNSYYCRYIKKKKNNSSVFAFCTCMMVSQAPENCYES